MVETWEIEWNSSMIKHGRDAGTMEFIFAKGGNISDMNYVMFDTQDNTWEPLIKAVAERDNSHPDIIRKQVPYGVTQDFRAAQPYAGTAVQSPHQARRQYKTQQTMQGLDNYQQDPNARNAMQAGLYGAAAGHAAANTGRAIMGGAQMAGRGIAAGANATKDFAQNTAGPAMGRAYAGAKDFAQNTAGPAMGRAYGSAKEKTGQAMRGAGRGMAAGAGKARDFMARKFPGIRQRMGNFMQGVGDTARHGMDALLGEKDATGKRVGDGVMARTIKRRGDQNQLDQLQTGRAGELQRQKQRASQAGHQSLRDEQMNQYQTDFDANEEAKKKLQADIDEAGPNAGLGGLRNKIRELGNKRRESSRTIDPASAAAGEAAKDAMEEGPVESALSDQSPKPYEEEDVPAPVYEEEDVPTPSTEMPAPEAGAPQPVADPAEEFARTQSEKIFRPGSSRRTGYNRLLEGARNKPESYEANAKNFGNRGFSQQIAAAVAEYHGLTPAQAEQVAQSAKQGNPKAKEMVEEATQGNDEFEEEDVPAPAISAPLTLSADSIDTRGWNLLMKQLAIR